MNRRVLDALARGGLRPVTVSPCAGLVAQDGTVWHWDLRVIRSLLAAGRTPLIHGDAVLDERRGFTILSTEELFLFLAARLHPTRVVLACDVEGVYGNWPRRSACASLIPVVDRTNIAATRRALRAAQPACRAGAAPDVTGGMAAKVERLYELVRRVPGLEARIVSGLNPGTVQSALLGGEVGTTIR